MRFPVALAGVILTFTLGCSQQPAQEKRPADTTATAKAAFDHYEPIRAALSSDGMDGVATHAAALAPLAEQAAGPKAREAADSLAKAESLEKAREQFASLSDALVPAFMDAKLTGVSAFTCPMIQKSWVQKGDQMANPYFGKSMLTCGAPYKPKT